MQFTKSSLPKILSIGAELKNSDYTEVIELNPSQLDISEIISLSPDLIVVPNDLPGLIDFIQATYLFARFRWSIAYKGQGADDFYDVAVRSALNKDAQLVSLYTSTYNSGRRIQRAYESLLNQTYKDWEWIIVDDSTTLETKEIIDKITSIDPRVRYYRFDSQSRGVIGEAKYRASELCNGFVCMEFDHDDYLTQDAVELLARAANTFPECGFFYSDAVEYNFNEHISYQYEEPFGLGYCHHYPSYYQGETYYPSNAPELNPKTIRHIVSVPNHFRAWRTPVLRQLGYCRQMRIADDYELMVRTFLTTMWCHIPKMLYIQSMGDGNSQDFSKNRRDIQWRVATIANYYSEQISKRCKEFYGVDDPCARLSHWQALDVPNEKIPGPFNVTLTI